MRLLPAILWRIVNIVAPTGESQYVTLFFVSRVVSAGLAAILAMVAFAVAGAANVGGFAAVASVCAVAGGTAGGWTSQAVLRFHQLSSGSLLEILDIGGRRGWAFTAGALLAGSLVAASLPISLEAGRVGSFSLALAFSTSFAILSVQVSRAMALYKGLEVLWLEVARAVSLTGSPLVASVYRSGLPYIWRCVLVAVAIQCGSLVLALTLQRGAERASRESDKWPSGRAMYAYGVPLGIWIGLSSVYQYGDRVMLAWLASNRSAGEYSLLYDISNRGIMLPITAFSGAAASALLRLFSVGEGAKATSANRRLAKAQAVMLIALLPPVAGCAYLAMNVIPWFHFAHALATVLVYAAGATWSLADTLQRERLGSGRTAPLVKWLGVCAVGGVLLNLIAIPLFGIVGAALVTLMTSVAYAAVVAADAGIIRQWNGRVSLKRVGRGRDVFET